jgi:hypothetical protein
MFVYPAWPASSLHEWSLTSVLALLSLDGFLWFFFARLMLTRNNYYAVLIILAFWRSAPSSIVRRVIIVRIFAVPNLLFRMTFDLGSIATRALPHRIDGNFFMLGVSLLPLMISVYFALSLVFSATSAS